MNRTASSVLAGLLFISGCAGSPSTNQDPGLQRMAMAAFAQRIAAAPPPQLSGTPTVDAGTPGVASIEESTLAERLARLPVPPPGRWTRFDKAPDGFKVNGQTYLAPEGRITGYGADEQSGDVVYLVQQGASSRYEVKYLRASANAAPVLIGTSLQSFGSVSFESVTGQRLSGTRLFPTSRGVLVTREQTGFLYTAGQGVRSFTTPAEFHVASFQNGDIASTGYLLLERDNLTPSGSLTGELGKLGHLVGVAKKSDYALYGIQTQTLVPIPIALSDKDSLAFGDCQRVNRMVSKCDQSETFESLWQTNGERNAAHPFWRITWVNSRSGPLMLAKEGSLGSTVAVTLLNTSTRIPAFERTLGVNDFWLTRSDDGKLTLHGRLGFSNESIDDLDAFLASRKPAS